MVIQALYDNDASNKISKSSNEEYVKDVRTHAGIIYIQ